MYAVNQHTTRYDLHYDNESVAAINEEIGLNARSDTGDLDRHLVMEMNY